MYCEWKTATNAHSLDSLPTLAHCNNQTVAVKHFQCVQNRLNFHSPLDCTFGHNFFFRLFLVRFYFVFIQLGFNSSIANSIQNQQFWLFLWRIFARLPHLDSKEFSLFQYSEAKPKWKKTEITIKSRHKSWGCLVCVHMATKSCTIIRSTE